MCILQTSNGGKRNAFFKRKFTSLQFLEGVLLKVKLYIISFLQVRVENLKNASDHIGEVLKRVKPEYLARIYKVASYKHVDDFLEQVAALSGRLLKVNTSKVQH